MSYAISITRCPIPATDAEAWKALDALQKLESGAQSNDFIELIELFKNEFPCICDLPDETVDELGVWSDGPLTEMPENIASRWALCTRPSTGCCPL